MALVDVHFAGHSFKLEGADGADQVARQMAAGAYEPPLPFLMMATLIRTEGAFLDIGANTGLYSVLAGVMTTSRPIIAFEPHPSILNVLKGNLACNNLSERVQIYDIALSDVAGRLNLYIPDQSHGLFETSASLEQNFQPVFDSIKVEVKRLDDLDISEQVAVVKVDIEGHEHAFLQGARDLIERDRPIIFGEVLRPARRNIIGKFLRDTGYIDFRLRPDMVIHDGEIIFDDSAWNHAFVPIERLAKFKEACDSCGLPMLRRFSVS